MAVLGRKSALRPGFLALKQLCQRLRAYEDIRRLLVDDAGVRIYEIQRRKSKAWIAWIEPDDLILSTDPTPRVEIDLPVDTSTVMIERMISRDGQLNANRTAVIPVNGFTKVILTPYPTYIYSSF